MALDGFVGLYRGLIDGSKSLLTPRDFGTNYDILCSELSIQSLRVRLWGESVGLHIDIPEEIQNSVLARADIVPTIVEILNTISSLLIELTNIRRKYQRKEISRPESNHKQEQSATSQRILNPIPFRYRRRRGRKGVSVIATAKWTLCDAKKFEEKVKKLKCLIDGLEDISRIAGISSRNRTSTALGRDEHPPRYSDIGPRVQPPNQTQSETLPPTPPVARVYRRLVPDVFEHYNIMKTYLASTIDPGRLSPNLRDKLVRLTNFQFDELRIDVCDELLRRQQHDETIQYLPADPSFHPKHNEARRRLSSLLGTRFANLVSDTVSELERRMPHLQSQPSFPDPFATHRSFETRRWGCVRPHAISSPPPFLQYRAAHHSTISSPTRPPSVEIFKSFRVGMDDPTWKVLPAALKKYNIRASAGQYALYVVWDEEERCLEMDEKPLLIFKRLDREGKKPMFMLRKVAPVRMSFERVDFWPPVRTAL